VTLVIMHPEDLESLVERAVRRALETGATVEVLSTAEAAALARRSPKTVRRWIRTRRLRAQRSGRRLVVRRADLTTFLDGKAVGVAAAAIARSVP
jgi:excisionase family DNA binding protein